MRHFDRRQHAAEHHFVAMLQLGHRLARVSAVSSQRGFEFRQRMARKIITEHFSFELEYLFFLEWGDVG